MLLKILNVLGLNLFGSPSPSSRLLDIGGYQLRSSGVSWGRLIVRCLGAFEHSAIGLAGAPRSCHIIIFHMQCQLFLELQPLFISNNLGMLSQDPVTLPQLENQFPFVESVRYRTSDIGPPISEHSRLSFLKHIISCSPGF